MALIGRALFFCCAVFLANGLPSTLDADRTHRARPLALAPDHDAVGLLAARRGGLAHGGAAAAELARVHAEKRAAARARSPERLEEWVDAGQAAVTDHSALWLSALSSAITTEAYHDELQAIATVAPSRFIGQPGNVQAAEYVRSEFEALNLTVWVEPLGYEPSMPAYVPPGEARSAGVLGRLDGTDLAHEVVLVGAHFDSINLGDLSGAAPGVDDNGSGLALVMLAARALAQSGTRSRRSILFAAFNAEEVGLYGSRQISQLAATGKYGDVAAVIIADEVAWPGSAAPMRQAIFETIGTVPGTSALLDTFAHGVLEGDGVEGFKVNKHGFASDHVSFLHRQIPTVLLIEGDNMQHASDWGHSERDTFEHVDCAFGAAMSRLALRTAATLASPAD